MSEEIKIEYRAKFTHNSDGGVTLSGSGSFDSTYSHQVEHFASSVPSDAEKLSTVAKMRHDERNGGE
jgi:hypothetical protein